MKLLVQKQQKGKCDHCGGQLWIEYAQNSKSGVITYFCRKNGRKDILHKIESPERRFAEFSGIKWVINSEGKP